MCSRVEWNSLGSRDAEAISESIAEILVENLPEAWSCEHNPDAPLWLLFGVTVRLVDSPNQGRRRFNAWLSYSNWHRSMEPLGPSVKQIAYRQTSVRVVAEYFEPYLRDQHRVMIEIFQR